MANQKQNKKTWGKDPQYFGVYLNMARSNIYNISNHLAETYGITPIDDEGKISKSFLVDKNNQTFKNKLNHVFSKIVLHMPIAKVFDFETLPADEKDKSESNFGKDFNKLSETLKVVFDEINEFRNDYSHYYSTEKRDKKKQRVSEELRIFLKDNFIRAKQYSQQRFKDVFSEEDFKITSQVIVVKDDNTITQDGIVFLTSIFLDRENAFQFINKITGLKGTQTKGFKAKREVLMAFCVRLPHDKFVSENTEQAFSLDLINELNKCPKTLYNVITEKEIRKYKFKPQLEAEQIENVLNNSVPADNEDYNSYIEGITKRVRNKNRFSYFALKYIDYKGLFKSIRFQIDLGRVILDEYTKPLNGKEETRKVIENAKAFGALQNFNDKDKVLSKINVGENKTYFEQFAPCYNFDNKYNKIGIRISSKKEITAIYLPKKTDKKVKFYLKQPLPEAFLSIHELPKIILLEYLENGKAEQLINDFIEINNLKILNKEFIEIIKSKLSEFDIFYKRSQGRKEISAYKNSTLKYLHSRKEKLNQILAEYKLNIKQIPTRILDYWLNIQDVQSKTAISDRIKLMKRDCMDRLKAIDKRETPKIGEMATFLAKDIIDMIIGEKKKKIITTFYYDKMQECLALFADNEKKELFIHICNNELKLNDDEGHPFLKNIDIRKIRYTSELYKRYLEEKSDNRNERNNKDTSWLARTFYLIEKVEVFDKKENEKVLKPQTVVKLPRDKSKLPFTLRQLEKEKSPFDKWLENVTKGKEITDKKKPVDLPTNLFDDELKELLKTELSINNIVFNSQANYNELFKIWWKECRKDDTQSFYDAEREYSFEEEKLNFKMNTQPRFKGYIQPDFIEKVLNIKQALKNVKRNFPPLEKSQIIKTITSKIGNTEKKIRILQEEDRLILLLFEKMTDNDLNLRLKDVDKLLSESILIKQNIAGELSFTDNGEVAIKKDRKKITKTITETRKRKEYSVLEKYIFDRRLPELFEYFKEDDISIEKIKLELDAYTKTRDIVFDIVFELEKLIITNHLQSILEINQKLNEEDRKLLIKKLDENSKNYEAEKKKIIDRIDNRKNIPHKSYLIWLFKKEIIAEKEFTFMNMVRNTFSHNQFPQKKTMELFITKWNDNKFACQILEIYKQKTDNISEKLKEMKLFF